VNPSVAIGIMGNVPTVPENYVKVRLFGPDGEVETPWAERIGEYFRLDNLPWFAYGVSDDDLVKATPTEHEGVFDFVRVQAPSGNRLVRIIFDNQEQTAPVLDHLTEMGCHYEGYNKGFVAVSIPAAVSFEEVCSYLIDTCEQWEHANPTYDQLHSG
jgi:hypothetical protein